MIMACLFEPSALYRLPDVWLRTRGVSYTENEGQN